MDHFDIMHKNLTHLCRVHGIGDNAAELKRRAVKKFGKEAPDETYMKRILNKSANNPSPEKLSIIGKTLGVEYWQLYSPIGFDEKGNFKLYSSIETAVKNAHDTAEELGIDDLNFISKLITGYCQNFLEGRPGDNALLLAKLQKEFG